MNHKIDLACIIDDDKFYVKMLSWSLDIKKLYKEFLVFENGSETYAYFKGVFDQPEKERIPQVILLDLNMPVMDGWQFLIECVKKFEEISDYWVKPIFLGELEKMFEKVYC